MHTPYQQATTQTSAQRARLAGRFVRFCSSMEPERHGHFLRWPASADTERGCSVLLLHGFLDAARSWQATASALAAAGHTAIALDLRGHGDGHRVDPHDYYHFADYLLDVDRLVQQSEDLQAPFALVGHSMGGMVATLYAGTFPEQVSHFINIEGLGPPETDLENNPQRSRRFVLDVRKIRDREPIEPRPRSEFLRRLALTHPEVPEPILEAHLDGLVREVEPGGFVWKHDPLHRSQGPYPFRESSFARFASNIASPVLYISGGTGGFRLGDEAQRLAAFTSSRRQVTFAGAGHMVHWTQPAQLAQAILDHLKAHP